MLLNPKLLWSQISQCLALSTFAVEALLAGQYSLVIIPMYTYQLQ